MAEYDPAVGGTVHHQAIWGGFSKLLTYSTASVVILLVFLGLVLL